jgi:hypothetical protein
MGRARVRLNANAASWCCVVTLFAESYGLLEVRVMLVMLIIAHADFGYDDFPNRGPLHAQ